MVNTTQGGNVMFESREFRAWLPSIIFASLAMLFIGLAPYTSLGFQNVAFPVGLHLFVVMAGLGLYTIWRERTIIHPLLFLLTTTALFIWGRFAARVMGLDGSIFSDSFYVPFVLTREESLALGASVSAGLLAIWAGYYAVGNFPFFSDRKKQHRVGYPAVIPIAVLMLVLGAMGTVAAYFNLSSVCETHGYLGIFKGHEQDNLARIGLVSQYVLLVGLGLSFASNNRNLMIAGVIAVGIYYLMYFGFGVRGGFIGYVFLLIWLLSRSFSGWKLLAIPLILVFTFFAAQIVISYGCRGDATRMGLKQHMADSNNIGRVVKRMGLNGARVFTYLQGSTFVYVGMARRIDHYPASVKLGSLLPGLSFVVRRIDPSMSNEDFLLPHYLSQKYSPKLYADGRGIGWSIFADFYVYGGGTLLGFVLVATLFGVLLGGLVRASYFNAFANGALICIFVKFVILPRTGLYSLSPYLIAYTGLFLACIIAQSLLSKARN